MGGWIGVDLDGTLAHYDRWRGPEHIGAPVPAMIERVKAWIMSGREVRILTARVDPTSVAKNDTELETVRSSIQNWCVEHIGRALPVTSRKDFSMIELWDDRCVQVEPNTGRRIDGKV